MPLSPEEAAAATELAGPDAQTKMLYNEIDRQLAAKERATVWGPSTKYGSAALSAARETYAGLGWKVEFQAAGQFDVDEGLFISKP